MAKFNIEVELDWLDDESNLDEAIKKEVVKGLQNRLVGNIENKLNNSIAVLVEEKANKVADAFLQKVLNEKLDNIQIPIKTSSWGSEVIYTTLTEFVGKRFETAMSEKVFNHRGDKASYHDDKKYSIVEYLTNDFIAKELNSKVTKMIKEAKEKAEKSLIASLEENLQQQLHSDMVKRLNIPLLLQKLQNTIDVQEELNNGNYSKS